jgi:hypothetical protein
MGAALFGASALGCDSILGIGNGTLASTGSSGNGVGGSGFTSGVGSGSTSGATSGPSGASTGSAESSTADSTGTSSEPGMEGGDATVDATEAATIATDSDAVASCTNACAVGLTQCGTSGAQTCQTQTNGCTQWVTTAACGTHQTCMGAGADGGPASCRCTSSACGQTGTLCQDAQTLATCAKDADGCFYATSTSPCTMPMSCSGMAPSAACSLTCANSCTSGETSCVNGQLATCTLGSNGCYSYGAAVACGTHQSCTGAVGSAACTCDADPPCSAVGMTCANSTTLATCTMDSQNCVYESATSTCTNGACSAGACCQNLCTNGTTECSPTSSTNAVSCAVSSNGCTAWQTIETCGSGFVCEAHSSFACVDPTWAEWTMPNSPVDVANGAPNAQHYTDNGDGTVTDMVTGLVWQQATQQSNCQGVSFAGYSDWRVPSMIELFSIVDPSSINPSIDTTYFPNTPAAYFWSSEVYPSALNDYWVVSFYDGNTYNNPSSPYYYRCVR